MSDNKSNENNHEDSVIHYSSHDHDKKKQINLTNGIKSSTEQELNEQAAIAAAAAISGDSNKQTMSNPPDAASRRKMTSCFHFVCTNFILVRNFSSADG